MVAGAATLVAIETAQAPALPLDRAGRGWYGLGEAANATKTVLTGLFVLYFYTSVVGMPGALVGLASALALVADAVLEPWIGRLSDRAQWLPLGRRHGLMLLGSLAIGPCFWAQFAPPVGAPLGLLFVWVLLTGFAVRFANSLFVVPYYALGVDLTLDYRRRTEITAIRGVAGLLATMAAAVLSFALFFPADGSGRDPKLNPAGYATLGLVFGICMTVATLVSMVKTRRFQLATDIGDDDHRLPSVAAIPGLITTSLGNAPFRRLFFSYALAFISLAVNSTLSIDFLTYYAQIAGGAALSQLQAAFYMASLVGVVLWVRLGRALDKRILYLTATALLGGVLLGARLLVGPGHPFGTGNVLPLLIGEALAGIGASLFAILPYSMLADIVDHDELRTGERREGTFVGVFRVGQLVGTGLSVLVTGLLIDWFAGLVPGQAEQSELTIERIGLTSTVLPVMLLVAALVVFWGYGLSRQRVEQIQQQLGR